MNTLIRYQYRDGDNYKRQGAWTVRGMCSQAQAAGLRASCMKEDDSFFFVPGAVGIPALQPSPWDEQSDHPLHTIESIEMTGAPTDEDRTIGDLIEAFRARDWEADAIAATPRRAV